MLREGIVQVLINMKGKLTSSQKAPLHKIVTQARHANPPAELSPVLDRASAALKPQWSDAVTRQANELFAQLYSYASFPLPMHSPSTEQQG
jgi:hypothetical protein